MMTVSSALSRLAAGLTILIVAAGSGYAEQAPGAPAGAPAMAPVPRSCETPGTVAIAGSQLPRVATALKERKTIRILTIGGPAAAIGGRSPGGPYGLIEKFLETSFKGLDVEIIDRGVSGELAADAAERMRTEVGLNDADLVLWQLGTADAMAGVAPDDVGRVIAETVTWLKEHNVDLILIGLRYAAQLAGDPQYQAMRRVIREMAAELGIMRLGRYETEETLARIRGEKGQELSEVEASDAAYVCMAEYLSRAIASGLFARPSMQRPATGTGGQGEHGAPPAIASPEAADQPASQPDKAPSQDGSPPPSY